MDEAIVAATRAFPVALTIAGFDPSSGAGITADLKVFAAHHVYGVASITALTVQSTMGVRATEHILPAHAEAVLDCLAEDFPIEGIKIGMLGAAGMVRVVSRFVRAYLERRPQTPVVLDPVLRSSSGAVLLEEDGVQALRTELAPLASCVTPNREELAVLTASTLAPAAVLQAAHRLREEIGAAVVVTGGDLSQPDDLLLTRSGTEHRLEGRRVRTTSDHGTGCAFSSALLCGLMKGQTMEAAAAAAKRYVHDALEAAVPLGHGRGPMHHLFASEQR